MKKETPSCWYLLHSWHLYILCININNVLFFIVCHRMTLCSRFLSVPVLAGCPYLLLVGSG